jgi:hypothetical protein
MILKQAKVLGDHPDLMKWEKSYFECFSRDTTCTQCREQQWFTSVVYRLVWTSVNLLRVHYQWKVTNLSVNSESDEKYEEDHALLWENVMNDATIEFDCFDRICAMQFAVICGERRSFRNVADDDLELGDEKLK